MTDHSWRDKALCREIDPEMFFPVPNASAREPKSICAACDVRNECLEYAMLNDVRFGVWGGFTPEERRRLKRARNAS